MMSRTCIVHRAWLDGCTFFLGKCSTLSARSLTLSRMKTGTTGILPSSGSLSAFVLCASGETRVASSLMDPSPPPSPPPLCSGYICEDMSARPAGEYVPGPGRGSRTGRFGGGLTEILYFKGHDGGPTPHLQVRGRCNQTVMEVIKRPVDGGSHSASALQEPCCCPPLHPKGLQMPHFPHVLCLLYRAAGYRTLFSQALLNSRDNEVQCSKLRIIGNEFAILTTSRGLPNPE